MEYPDLAERLYEHFVVHAVQKMINISDTMIEAVTTEDKHRMFVACEQLGVSVEEMTQDPEKTLLRASGIILRSKARFAFRAAAIFEETRDGGSEHDEEE